MLKWFMVVSSPKKQCFGQIMTLILPFFQYNSCILCSYCVGHNTHQLYYWITWICTLISINICHRGDSSPKCNRILSKRQKPSSSYIFRVFFCVKAPSCLIKNSPRLCKGRRMCLLQHFYALNNVQFVVLIEPSRPVEIAASALFNSLGVN